MDTRDSDSNDDDEPSVLRSYGPSKSAFSMLSRGVELILKRCHFESDYCYSLRNFSILASQVSQVWEDRESSSMSLQTPARAFISECCCVFHLSSWYKARPKMKLCWCRRARKMQLSRPTLTSFADFYIDLERFCCSLSMALRVYETTSSTIQLHVMGKFVFSHQKCYGREKVPRELDEF